MTLVNQDFVKKGGNIFVSSNVCGHIANGNTYRLSTKLREGNVFSRPPPMLILVHYEAHTVDKRVVGILLECFLVHFYFSFSQNLKHKPIYFVAETVTKAQNFPDPFPFSN